MAQTWEDAAVEILERLTDPHLEKKKTTILAIVNAKLNQQPVDGVFKQDGTCSHAIWHGKWKKDPVIAEVLEESLKLARRWKDGAGARAIAQAAERLALASPLAVGRAIQMLNVSDDKIKLQAAFGIIDRATKMAEATKQAEKDKSAAEGNEEGDWWEAAEGDDEGTN